MKLLLTHHPLGGINIQHEGTISRLQDLVWVFFSLYIRRRSTQFHVKRKHGNLKPKKSS